MKTKSIWGNSPTRIYKLMNFAEERFNNDFTTCIVGCSDGKFLMPFARRKHKVTGYDIDKIDLNGGMKEFPIRPGNPKYKYSKDFVPKKYELKPVEVLGVRKRVEIERLEKYAKIEERNFYKDLPKEKFDVVFTSCSLHYTINNKYTLKDKIDKLKSIVKPNGIIYIDYMMALEEDDYELYPEYKFFRNGQAAEFLGPDWEIISYYEQKKPVFEAGHVVTTEDHFHRFGYLMAVRRN